MVKERRRHRSRTSSSDSEESGFGRKLIRNRSRSPRHEHKSAKHKHKEKSSVAEGLSRMKQEPLSDSDQEEKYSKRQVRDLNQHNRERDSHRSRHDDRPIKREQPDSEEEMQNQREERRRNNDRRQQNFHQRRSHQSEHERYGRQQEVDSNNADTQAKPKETPNFELSGKLTEDTNTYKGIVIKYNEPPEARKPKKRWRLYPFKNDEPMKPFHMHRQSAYLLGRERLIADIPIDHPSCSKQHAVYQYRMVPYEKDDGRRAFRIAPYIIDLNSANGTFVNNKKIEPQKYVELFEKDVIKFGFSSREYVLLHDKSDTSELQEESD